MVDGIQELISALQTDVYDSSNTYNAEVSSIDNEGTVWVYLAGSNIETPTALSSAEVSVGDNVNVEWRNNKLYIAGNVSNPSAGTVRVRAVEHATEVAKQVAQSAVTDAGIARQAAEQATEYAEIANGAADRAETEANRAYKEAEKATGYANDSLSQLGIVEDVVGTLNWITTHATYKATADTEVHAGKWYFTKSGDTYNVVVNPTGNPSTKGWYEIDSIDEAVSNYVASHVALTDDGLWLTKDNHSYKILLASDGMRVYDNTGHLVSTYGESIIFDSSRPQKIGNNTSYIEYYDSNNDGTPDAIRIVADSISFSNGKGLYDDLEVGGRNLVLSSGHLRQELYPFPIANRGYWTNFTDIDYDGLQSSIETASWSELWIVSPLVTQLDELRGKKVTLSCELKASNLTTIASKYTLNFGAVYSDSEYSGYNRAYEIEQKPITDADYNCTLVNDKWVKISKTFDVPTTWDFTQKSYYRYIFQIKHLNQATATHTLYFRKPKAEVGNKATDWTPAPEDVQAEIDAKKSVHTIDSTYKPNYSTALNWAKTSQTYSNNGIDTTGVKVGDTVRLGALVNDFTGNPTVYVVGTVTAIGSKSSFTMMGKGLDTTIIDGGNILTNSIGANQIKANAIDTSKLTIGAQDEMLNSKIEVGGRNLVWDTEWKNISTRWSNWGSPTTREIVTANGKRWLHLVTTASAYQGYSQAQDKRNGYGEIKAGDKVVISYSAYAKTAGQICTVLCHWRNSSGTIVAQNWFSSTLTTTEKRYTSPVFTIPNNAVGFNVMIGDNTANAQELWISQVKIEFGTKATDWTPAPEDLAATATSYITDIGNDGIRVHPASTENNSVLINSDGMTVYKGGTADKDSVAFYGDTARIGEKASRHVEVKTGGMQVYNGEGDSNMVAHMGYESVQGETGTTMGAFFTFGMRKSNQTKGEYSVAEGYGVTASGWCSHAEGSGTTASGWWSHAEGHGTKASDYCSHAEGNGTTASGCWSHAEGNGTTASGWYSHAEGYGTKARGWYSHAGGYGTIAGRKSQTAIGEYNATAGGGTNDRGKYVLIVGNGTSDDARSNALTVSWDGNVELAIDSSATGSSTVDGKIMDSLRSLGWDASTEGVIV